MRPAVLFVVRRALRASLLVFAVSSAVLLLVHLAPGDAFSAVQADPETVAAERARFGLDRPFVAQYAAWLRRAVVLDFGESTRFHRPVTALLGERIGNTVQLGAAALVLALGIGLPAGVLTASAPRRAQSRIVRAASLLLIATPPLVTALVLLLLESRTGWPPRGLPLAALALGLPIAAALERLQSRAMDDALADPCITAARARGVSRARAVWVHALPLALKPVLGVLGIVIGTVLSGSFIVEYVTTWPGIGTLMYDALVARDLFLAAGCAAAGSLFLALGLLVTDLALWLVDPRTQEPA
ncbi:MAG TPA: ABC transporter permease [Vicinamibacterales bacterium]